MGDHFQLPPLVTSRAAEEGGLGISLFKRLCEAHPQVRLQSPDNDAQMSGWHLHNSAGIELCAVLPVFS